MKKISRRMVSGVLLTTFLLQSGYQSVYAAPATSPTPVTKPTEKVVTVTETMTPIAGSVIVNDTVQSTTTSLYEIQSQQAEVLTETELLQDSIRQVDSEITDSMLEVERLNKEVKEAQVEVNKAKAELVEAQESFERAFELSSVRLQRMQEQGTGGKWDIFTEVLLGSEGLSDFINRAITLSTIMDSDATANNDLFAQEKEIEKKKDALTKTLVSLQDKQKEALAESNRLQEKKKEVVEKVKQLELLKKDLEKKRLEEEARLTAAQAQLVTANTSLESGINSEAAILAAQAAQSAQEARSVQESNGSTVSDDTEWRLPSEAVAVNRKGFKAGLSAIDVSSIDSVRAQQVIASAQRFLGVPYLWGGTTPAGFDCSGLLQYVYRDVGVNLPRVARQQQKFGIQINPADAQPGDLLFIGKPAHHVAMYIGDGKYLHAPQTGDVVKISKMRSFGIWTSATRVLY